MQTAVPIADTARSSDRELWSIRVSTETPRFDEHWRHLDGVERQRAARFRMELDRARFVIARSSLRQLLAKRLGVAARDIEFAVNPFGKPCLRDARVALHFNTSHSGDWVLHAIDSAAPIGVDVEAVRAELADIDQFRWVLSPEERAFLDEVPASHRAHAFAKVWVRKEAYVKALGEGLSRPLPDISIAVDATDRPRLLYDRNAAGSLARWQFEDVEVDAQHVACLVYRADVD
jgi:4'-phosphopantetheinyl transferase